MRKNLALVIGFVVLVSVVAGCDQPAGNDYKDPKNVRSEDVKSDESGDK